MKGAVSEPLSIYTLGKERKLTIASIVELQYITLDNTNNFAVHRFPFRGKGTQLQPKIGAAWPN